jgi:hypothetical protein
MPPELPLLPMRRQDLQADAWDVAGKRNKRPERAGIKGERTGNFAKELATIQDEFSG